MKKISIILLTLLCVNEIFAQKGDVEKTFSRLTWINPNTYYEDASKFGYDKNTFKLKREKLSTSDACYNIIKNEDITFLGTYKNLKFYYSPGPSTDPTFYILNSSNKVIFYEMIEEMGINSSGNIYISGNMNRMFNIHKKFKIVGETVKEVTQPFLYVGIKGKVLKPVKLFSKKNNMGNLVAQLPIGYEIEVLLAEEDYAKDEYSYGYPKNYLVRTSFGLVGWLKLNEDDSYYMNPVIKGLGYMGD